jgi:hypothetical protein
MTMLWGGPGSSITLRVSLSVTDPRLELICTSRTRMGPHRKAPQLHPTYRQGLLQAFQGNVVRFAWGGGLEARKRDGGFNGCKVGMDETFTLAVIDNQMACLHLVQLTSD